MSDFVQTMKDWRRMCKHYSDEIVKNVQLSCIDICPLGHNITCDAIEDALDSDIEDAAKAIAQWATEHPEPVYPTWEMYLAERMIADMRDGKTHNPQSVEEYMRRTSIPADIAEKLGIEPKEDV